MNCLDNCFEYKFILVNSKTGNISWEEIPMEKNRKYISKYLNVTLRHTFNQSGLIEEERDFNIMESVRFAGDYEVDVKKDELTEDNLEEIESRTNLLLKQVFPIKIIIEQKLIKKRKKTGRRRRGRKFGRK